LKQHLNPGETELTTEARDERHSQIGEMNVSQLVDLMNRGDQDVPVAVAKAEAQISAAIEAISLRFNSGGRLVYAGAGTSGRIATLDASEIYPTFGVSNRVVALMAGGQDALVNPAEGAEDDYEAGYEAAKELGLGPNDSMVGVASSGSTPYVLGAMDAAKGADALVVSLSCNEDSPMASKADISIEVIVGPEFLTGSTRLKAGSAQKMVLNMISTITMMKAGKTFGNLMVDVVASNQKLRKRATKIVCTIESCSQSEAHDALEQNDWNVKQAVVAHRFSLDAQAAKALLAKHQGYLASALGEVQ
jgi:N-acetylmuramic acid 6-phosphate etherase